MNLIQQAITNIMTKTEMYIRYGIGINLFERVLNLTGHIEKDIDINQCPFLKFETEIV